MALVIYISTYDNTATLQKLVYKLKSTLMYNFKANVNELLKHVTTSALRTMGPMHNLTKMII